jgi:tRNA nucleotidyltransferase (CCA-adding enzyme)
VIGNTEKKLKEDPLRMLRALRLSIKYDFKIEESMLIFILNNKNLFKNISYERKKSEINKILISDNAKKGLDMLKSLGLLEVLEISYTDSFKHVKDLIGSWSQLEFSNNYPFSKIERARLNKIKGILQIGHIDEEVLYEYGLYDARVAGRIMGISIKKINNMYDAMPIHSKEELSITGTKIISLLGIEEGPLVKEIKKDLIKQVMHGNLPNSEEEISNYVLKKWK